MLELEQATARILAALPPAQREQISLPEAHGRVLLEPVDSPVDLPLFDNSGMDGYAARAEDISGATPQAPISLRLAGRVPAGEVFPGELSPGACVRLFTGSPLPRGADCVVMQEDTRIEEERPEEVLIQDAARRWENVRLRGEDVRVGTRLALGGQTLSAGHLCLLAAAGIVRVTVGRQARVGVIATGSELLEPGQPLSPGQIYESNRVGLAALIRSAGATPVVFPVVPDQIEEIEQTLSAAFAECDLVVTAGGVSVGELDLVKPALERLGGELEFWKVAIKPGRPFVFGRVRGKLLFGLPGNPVSAMVTFLLLVRPALKGWQGATDLSLSEFPGVLAESVANPGSRRHFVRVEFDSTGAVCLAGTQGSHLLSSLARAGGLVDVPPQSTLPAGSSVRVKVWEL